MPKRRFQCMLSEAALAELERRAGAPDKRQAWLERFLTTSPDPSGNYLISERGNVKSEPSPDNRALAEEADRRARLRPTHSEWREQIQAGQLDPEVEQGPREINEAYARLNPGKCPVLEYTGGHHVRVCGRRLQKGACPVHGEIVEPDADGVARATGNQGRESLAQMSRAGRLDPEVDVGQCAICEQQANDENPDFHHWREGEQPPDDPNIKKWSDPDPEAEQQAKDERKERKVARGRRKAALLVSVVEALVPGTLTAGLAGDPFPSLDATGPEVSSGKGKVAFQSFPKPPKRGGK